MPSLLDRRLRWLLVFLGWTLLGVFFATQAYIGMAYVGRPIGWAQALALALTQWYLWAAFAPLIILLARRFSVERRTWGRTLLLHLVFSILFTLVHLAVYAALAPSVGRLGREYTVGMLFWALFNLKFSSDFLTYWAIVGLTHAGDYYLKFRERELRAAQLEARLTQARLDLLKMRLHPHFLFNTLHAISVLVRKDPRMAERMISRLSDLLRMTLDSADAQEVPLQQELEFLQGYLEIEQVRFQERLTVHLEVDPAVLDAGVPNMLLQPLVENAVRHGIAQREQGGRIEVLGQRTNGHLELAVIDNGPGLAIPPEDCFRRGLGLSNTRARLQQLYGAEHQFALSPSSGGGLRVSLTIPYRAAGERPGGASNGVDDEHPDHSG